MANTENIFYGKISIDNKDYPFYFEAPLVTIIQGPWENNADLSHITFQDKITGITINNNIVIFLECEFLGGNLRPIYPNIVFSAKGFILLKKEEFHYNCIEFVSDALNTFYPPIQIADRNILFQENSFKIKSPHDTTKKFQAIINGEPINMELSIPWNFNLVPEQSSIGEKYTVWKMEFENNKRFEDLSQYYLFLLDFLTFINFRKNIIIDQIRLYHIEGENKSFIGTGYFFSHKKGYDSKCNNSITFNDFNINDIGALFSYIATQRYEPNFNDIFIPEDSRGFRYFSWIEWLNTALTLEGEYSKKYKNLKYESDISFANAKDLLINEINENIKKSGLSINNPKNESWKKFKYLIVNTDTRLEEKFQFLLDHFSEEIESLKIHYCRIYDVNESQVNLASEYADYRNCLAHGSIIDMSNVNKVNFCLMRVFIYCLILERANISKEYRKIFSEKLFKN